MTFTEQIASLNLVPVARATAEHPCDFCESLRRLDEAFHEGRAHLCPEHAREIYRFAQARGQLAVTRAEAEAAGIIAEAFADPDLGARLQDDERHLIAEWNL